MNKIKRILPLLLALGMLLSQFGGAAWADSADSLTFQNHVYRVYPSGTASTWEEAQAFCEQQGGHLAVISSDEENSAIYQYIRSRGYTSAYFGYSDAVSEGTWKWVTGEKNYYSNWHSGEPNSENSREDYAMFYWKFTNGQWNDGDFGTSTTNDNTTAFICEWEESSTTVTLSKSSLTLFTGKTATLNATVQPSGKTVTWSSSKTDIATVDRNGKVTAKKAGTCTITAAVDDVKATCSVTVKKPTIKLNKSSLSLDVKKTATLKATVDGPSKTVTWKSSNTKIATVDKNGKVTAKKEGKCTITATANGLSAKCAVKVLSEKDKAIEAYKKFLSQSSIPWAGESYPSGDFSFALIYIDNDSIPELVLSKSNSTHPEGFVALRTYKNGKILLLDQYSIIDFRYYPKKGAYIAYYQENGWGYNYYKTLSDGKVKEWLRYSRGFDMSSQKWVEYYHKVGSKKQSKIKKADFDKAIKKKVGSVNKSKVKTHKNTKTNRNKYLK